MRTKTFMVSGPLLLLIIIIIIFIIIIIIIIIIKINVIKLIVRPVALVFFKVIII